MRAIGQSTNEASREQEPRVLLAWVCAPWGRKGAVTLEVHTDWPERRFVAGHTLHLAWEDGRERDLVIRTHRRQGKKFLIEFEGVDDISHAQRLRGASIWAAPSELDREEDDGLLQRDLIGLVVVTRQGEVVGKVERIEEAVAADLLVVRCEKDRSEILIPLAEQISTVEMEAGRVVIDPPEGLLDAASSRADGGVR